MPFCYHCGKGVEDDWVACPYCGNSTTGSRSADIVVSQDSVVGEIVQNTDNSITNITTSPSSTSCPQCNASGNITIFVCTKDGCSNQMCNHCKQDYCQSCTHRDLSALYQAEPWRLNMAIPIAACNASQQWCLLSAHQKKKHAHGEYPIEGFDINEFIKSMYEYYGVPYDGPPKKKRGFFG